MKTSVQSSLKKKSRRINKGLFEFIKKNCPSIVDGSPPPSDPHHIITRGAGGPDDVWNLMPLTHLQHVECHKIGLTKFANKYPSVKIWLELCKWEFEESRNKWIPPYES